MGKIFCLMGKSSSGKDTVFKNLELDKSLNLKPIVPYTTRPKRSYEKDGVEYYFIDQNKLHEYEHNGKIIEERRYNTIDGIWCYCTIDDGQIDLNKYNYITISTLESYEKLQSYFNKENIIPLYIEVEDGKRLERAIKRESLQENPNYSEVCRIFLADCNDFSEERLKENNIKIKFNNYNLEECIKNIKNKIRNEVEKGY